MDQNIIEKIKLLEHENEILKQQLNKYTNPLRTKQYKERNKDKIQEYQKEYQKKYYEKKQLEKIKK
jgi:TRAP-type mannitol/chloroaromatic compound transport system substrate-binding protein